MHRTTAITWMMAALAIGACDAPEDDAGDVAAAPDTPAVSAAGERASLASATLRTADGADAGTATLTPANGGLALDVRATGLTPGEHGIHVHAVGRCDAASAFESAGEHLNPTAAQHGLENPSGPHLGDLPNLVVGADGAAHLSHPAPGLADSVVFDADGAALVIHAERDDQRTDPSGNSGGRIACGVLQRG